MSRWMTTGLCSATAKDDVRVDGAGVQALTGEEQFWRAAAYPEPISASPTSQLPCLIPGTLAMNMHSQFTAHRRSEDSKAAWSTHTD